MFSFLLDIFKKESENYKDVLIYKGKNNRRRKVKYYAVPIFYDPPSIIFHFL